MKKNLCEEVIEFIQNHTRPIAIAVVVLVFILSIKQVISITNLISTIIVCLFVYFFIEDFIKSFIKSKIDKKESLRTKVSIKKGVQIILGDWGAGKTHYFNNVYINENKFHESIVERISCFSYTREEFIKQIVAMSFWNRWLSLNGMLSGYISFNWHNMLPKNKVIFIDDLERLPCNNNMANDFIGIIEKLKKYNHVVIACSHLNIKQEAISQYLEKMADYMPIEITLEKQMESKAIINTIKSTINNISERSSLMREINRLIEKLQLDDGVYKKHKSLVYFFTKNYSFNDSEAINLRNIKKVFENIYIQQEADKIIEVITNLITEELPREMNIENIKSCWRYYKIKEKIQEYLIIYELLFAYPNLKPIIQKYKQKDKTNNSESFKKYIKDYVKDKHLRNLEILNFDHGLEYLINLSFYSIGQLLAEINELSEVNDDDFLSDILAINNITFIKTEKDFFKKESVRDIYGFYKKQALQHLTKDNELNFNAYLRQNTYVGYEGQKEIRLSYKSSSLGGLLCENSDYINSLSSFWNEIMIYLISRYETIEALINKAYQLIKGQEDDFSIYNKYATKMRFLTLIEWYCKKENIKPNISDEIKKYFYEEYNRTSEYLENPGNLKDELFLFDLFINYDTNMQPTIDDVKEAVRLHNKGEDYSELKEKIEQNFYSMFTKVEPSVFKIRENKEVEQ